MAITVGQLKAQLADYPDEAVIVMQGEYESEGDQTNYFLTVDGEKSCLRQEDLEIMEISKRKWGKPVAVAY